MAKACIVKSGPKKGKLKKGWRFGANGSCVRAKSSSKSSGRKKGRRSMKGRTCTRFGRSNGRRVCRKWSK